MTDWRRLRPHYTPATPGWGQAKRLSSGGHKVDQMLHTPSGSRVVRRYRAAPGEGLCFRYRAVSATGEWLGPWRGSFAEAKADVVKVPRGT